MQRLLVILDVDETLIHATEALLGRECDFLVGPYFVYTRPHLRAFLDNVLTHFDCAIWSSASGDYVESIVRQIIPDVSQLKFIWSGGRCTRRYDPERMEQYWLKDLNKIKRRGFDLKRTIMLDDSSEKVQRHFGNHLSVQPFTGSPDDTELRDVIPALEWLRDVPNVREVEKRGWRSRFAKAGLVD